jgi:hypothetical protein
MRVPGVTIASRALSKEREEPMGSDRHYARPERDEEPGSAEPAGPERSSKPVTEDRVCDLLDRWRTAQVFAWFAAAEALAELRPDPASYARIAQRSQRSVRTLQRLADAGRRLSHFEVERLCGQRDGRGAARSVWTFVAIAMQGPGLRRALAEDCSAGNWSVVKTRRDARRR